MKDLRVRTKSWRMGHEDHTSMAGPEEGDAVFCPSARGWALLALDAGLLQHSWHWERGGKRKLSPAPRCVPGGLFTLRAVSLWSRWSSYSWWGTDFFSNMTKYQRLQNLIYSQKVVSIQNFPQLYLRHQLGIVLLFCHTAESMFPSCCTSWSKSDTHQANPRYEAQNSGTTHYPGGQKTPLNSPFWLKTGIGL